MAALIGMHATGVTRRMTKVHQFNVRPLSQPTRGLRANLGGISIYQQTNACKPIILKYINIKT